METETKLIAATVHGRLLVRRAEGTRLLMGFHGYGENAERHLAELERVAPDGRWTLAAVQALHPFYLRRSQEVVASWMTRLDREAAIADNLGYVAAAVRDLGAPRPLVFAGFSQGAAMAWRAASRIPCDGLIVLGGDIPPDVGASAPLPPALIGRGNRDEWYTTEKLKKDLSFLGSREVHAVEFDGGHEWTDEFRAAARDFLSRIG